MFDSRSRLLRATFTLIGLGVLFLLACSVAPEGGALEGFADNYVYNAIELLAVAACASRAISRSDERKAWAMIAVGLLLWSAGDLTWTLWLDNLASPPFPSVADGFYLAMYPAMYIGLISLTRTRFRHTGITVWLDGVVVGLATAAVGAAWVLPDVVHASHGAAFSAVATNLAYPLADFVLLVFIALGFALSQWRPGRQWLLLALGISLSTIADIVYVYEVARGTYVEGGILEAMWPTAMALIALAAWQRSPVRAARHEVAPSVIAPPAVASLVTIALLVSSSVQRLSLVSVGLAAGALLAAGTRAYLTHQENVRMLRARTLDAVTDALTGLGNRRRLLGDLEVTFERVAAGAAATLLFYDLDGFKRYNDSFGHGAGDALLERLGGALERAVAGRGRAYRLGGDEFCVLLDGRAGHALIERTRDALTEFGSGFSVSASCGAVLIPDEAEDISAALNLADERMYMDKSAGERSSRARAQSVLVQQSVLMQLLTEREPTLHRHVCDVGAMAVAIGRALGLDSEHLDELRRAAELHDIGKLAVPDEIVKKPGPLSDSEWQLMRQHTIIGERILSAAPALRPVGRLIRSSHERWDGGGYPDGLAGEEIPLGARIIAACDAYDAITAERPYDAARPHEQALAELHANAGTQFDPRVVEAVTRYFSEGVGTRRESAGAPSRSTA